MFSTVRYFIKTSIGFLFLGILTGLYMSFRLHIQSQGYPAGLISAHTHIILTGSVMMMIMGVALWFFPRPEKTDKRYKPDLVYAVYLMMTIATLFRFLTEVVTAFSPELRIEALITVFSFFQVIALFLFFYSIWGRIRPLGSHLREANGEKF